MATQDREPRPKSGAMATERRVDPGVNTNRPERVDPPSKLSPAPPRGQVMTGAEKRMPVKR